MSLFYRGRWIESCECGCGKTFEGASGEIAGPGGRTLLVACDAVQRAYASDLDEAKRQAHAQWLERRRKELRRDRKR